jgi:hypothetical protein
VSEPSLSAEPSDATPERAAERRVAAAPRARAPSIKSTEKSNKVAASETESVTTDEPAATAEASEKPATDPKEGTDVAEPAEGPLFDRDAAATALGDAASRAQSCAKLGGPTGTGSVTITFGTNGQVTGASVGGDYAGTSVGACVVKLFRTAKIPAFGGQPIAVSKRFSID